MLTSTRISHLSPRRSASAEAAALKLAEREGTDRGAWLPVAATALAERRDIHVTRRCAMAEAAALKLEEGTC
jgi:hypothetical protein